MYLSSLLGNLRLVDVMAPTLGRPNQQRSIEYEVGVCRCRRKGVHQRGASSVGCEVWVEKSGDYARAKKIWYRSVKIMRNAYEKKKRV